MKTAIDLLTDKRKDLFAAVQEQTSNAEYYSREAKKSQTSVTFHQNAVANMLRHEQASCLKRNDLQRQLNEVDAAIAKLEQP